MVLDNDHTFEHTIHWNISHLLLATAILFAAWKLSPVITSDTPSDPSTDTPVETAELLDE